MHCQREPAKESYTSMKKINRLVLINCIHYYISKRAEQDNKIRRSQLHGILGIGFHIPKEHQGKVINELKELKIIFDDGKDWVKVKKIEDRP